MQGPWPCASPAFSESPFLQGQVSARCPRDPVPRVACFWVSAAARLADSVAQRTMRCVGAGAWEVLRPEGICRGMKTLSAMHSRLLSSSLLCGSVTVNGQGLREQGDESLARPGTSGAPQDMSGHQIPSRLSWMGRQVLVQALPGSDWGAEAQSGQGLRWELGQSWAWSLGLLMVAPCTWG